MKEEIGSAPQTQQGPAPASGGGPGTHPARQDKPETAGFQQGVTLKPVAGGVATEALYRREAVEARRESVWGTTVLVQPVHHMWLTGLTALTIMTFLGFLMVFSYSRSETVTGALVPEAGFIRVIAPRRGVIAKVHVLEDEQVEAGAPLITVNVEIIAGDGTAVGSDRLAALEAKQDALARLLGGMDAELNAEKEAIIAERAGISNRLEAVRAGLDNSHQLVALAQRQLKTAGTLRDQGALSDTRVFADQQMWLRLNQEHQSVRALERELVARLRQLELKISDLPRRINNERAELEAALADVEGEISLTKGQRSYTLRAEVPGRVAALQAVAGHVADPRYPLMTLLPIDKGLIAELYVPTRAVGFMRPGQDVRLRYDAFPHRRFGDHPGTVEQVSKTILLPDDMPMAVGLDEPAYRIVVRPQRQTVSAYGEDYRLQAGMLLQSEIILEERTLMRWLLDPLYSLQGRN